jgi:hypothetical protein
MGKAPQSRTGVADRSQADALRRLALVIKAGGRSRREISGDAGIDGVQLDDFITTRPNSKTVYRTIVPHDTFQNRLLVYLLGLDEVRRIQADVKHPNHNDVKLIEAGFARLVRNYGGSPDPLFEYYKSKTLATSEGSSKTSDLLDGQFYAFRFSSGEDKLVKTYFKMQKPRRSENILTFVNYRKEPDSTFIRETEGHVINIGENFVFFGFVKGVVDGFVGVKIVVLHHDDLAIKDTLSGVYMSHDNDGSYDVGRMILTRTPEKFDKKNIGMVSLDQLNDRDLLALTLPQRKLSELSALISGTFTGLDASQVREKVMALRLHSSINIKITNRSSTRDRS